MKHAKKKSDADARPGVSRWRVAAFFMAAFGAVLIVLSLPRSLEYDEAWTLKNYIDLPLSAIFSDLATPNNHPLNTLSVKIMCALIADGKLWLTRVSALLSWFAMMGIGIAFLRRRVRDDVAVFCGSAALALNGMLLHYAGTARGYSLQSFFILLAWISMFSLVKDDRNKRAFAGLVAGALGALFSISSGALLAAALGIAAGCAYLLPVAEWRSFFRNHRYLWCAGGIFAAAALAWFLPHWDALQEARKFGIPLHGVLDYLAWAWNVLWSLRLVPWLLAAIAVLAFDRGAGRRDAVMTLLFPLGCLFLSLFTNPGPERVYTGVIPVVILSCTCALAQSAKWSRYVLAAAVLCTVLTVKSDMVRLEGPDWRTVALKAAQMPEEVLPLYRASASLPVHFNTPEAVKDWRRRLSQPKIRTLIALEPPEGQLEASDKDGNPVTFTPGAAGVSAGKIERASAVQYGVKPLETGARIAGQTLLLYASNVPRTQLEAFWRLPEMASEHEQWLECNIFLNERPKDINAPFSRLWILPRAERPAEAYCRIADEFKSMTFYEITAFSPQK